MTNPALSAVFETLGTGFLVNGTPMPQNPALATAGAVLAARCASSEVKRITKYYIKHIALQDSGNGPVLPACALRQGGSSHEVHRP